MSEQDLPVDWTLVPEDQSKAGTLPESSDPEYRFLYGGRMGREHVELFRLPASTPFREIIQFFKVGKNSQYLQTPQIYATMADVLERVNLIASGHISQATPIVLEFSFTEPLQRDQFDRIAALILDDENITDSLEYYMSEWDGEASILQPILSENRIYFWWD